MKTEFDAVRSRLTDSAALEDLVFDVIRKNADGDLVQDNYVVLSMSVPEESLDRWTAVARPGDTIEVSFNTQIVAVDPAGVMLLVDDVKGQLLGQRLTVAGLASDPIRRLPDIEEGEIRHDRTAGLYYVHMSWAFTLRASR